MPELPVVPKNNPEIISRIETAKGPVGPGHHNSHRTSNITDWLQSKEKGDKGAKDSKAGMYQQAVSKAAAKGKK